MTRAATLRSADDLVAAGLTPDSAREALRQVGARYVIAITPHVAKLIASNDDPIALQFMPDARELISLAAERADPIGDHAHSPVKGVVHRYENRALFKIASVCPVYCRFCFRREMVGPENGDALSAGDVARALDYFRATPAIREVILTGGDPLILSPRRIAETTLALAEIPHVEKLRWHTRVPVVAPERVTAELVEALTSSGKPVRIAIHANHAREFSAEARAAIARLADAGVTLLSQSVLLRGVNDDADALEAMMRAFLDCGISPYYLHHGDLAPGASHFRTTIADGRALMGALSQRLPSSCIPRYMLDLPGGFGKVDLMSGAVDQIGANTWRIIDRFGASHDYRDEISPPAG